MLGSGLHFPGSFRAQFSGSRGQKQRGLRLFAEPRLSSRGARPHGGGRGSTMRPFLGLGLWSGLDLEEPAARLPSMLGSQLHRRRGAGDQRPQWQPPDCAGPNSAGRARERARRAKPARSGKPRPPEGGERECRHRLSPFDGPSGPMTGRSESDPVSGRHAADRAPIGAAFRAPTRFRRSSLDFGTLGGPLGRDGAQP